MNTDRPKVVLVVIDGLGFDTAITEMGFLEGQVEAGRARRWRMRSVLPSLSRPCYETLLTGVPPAEHGITSNGVVRPSSMDSIFTIARAHGRRTGAAAYSWFSELANGVPFDPVMDREVTDGPGGIQFGRFYVLDPFPDQELYWQADRLIRRNAPDLMLVHPMGCDHMGHAHGGDSLEYRRAAAHSDDALARLIPDWQSRGYRVVVTADHGMCADGHHGGTADKVRDVPFWLLAPPEGVEPGLATDVAGQCAVAPTILDLMHLPIPEPMVTQSLLKQSFCDCEA